MSLDDPMLRFAIANLPVDTFSFDQEAMTQKQVSIQQKFPFPGKLGLKGDIARRDVVVVNEEYNEKKNSIIRQVKTVRNELLFLESSFEITTETKGLLEGFITAAETKYSTGKGSQQDAVKARMELSRIIKKVISINQKREAAYARLNSLLGRPVQAELHLWGELTETLIELSRDELYAAAEQTSPALMGMEQKIERSRLAGRLAEREYYPDMDFGVTYGQRDDGDMGERPDFLSAAVTFNIPLWYRTKESRKVAEEKANERWAVEQYNAMRNAIDLRIRELIAEIDMYRQEMELLKTGLIPQGSLSFESALSGYKVNMIDIMTLINNQISLYNYKLEYFRAVASHENSLAELEETIGRPIYPVR